MLLICILAYVCVSSYQLLIVPVCCTAVAELCRPPSSLPSQPSFLDLPTHLFCLLAADKKSRDCCCVSNSSAILPPFHVRLCWVKIDSAESWRDTELEDHTMCFVRDRLETCSESGSEWQSDATGEVLVLVRRVILLCFWLHCDTVVSCLTNDMLTTSSSTTDCYDDWRQASPTICCPSYDTSSPFHHCHLLCAASYVFWVTLSVLYYVIDSIPLFTC